MFHLFRNERIEALEKKYSDLEKSLAEEKAKRIELEQQLEVRLVS
jgi:hypothetical protein